LKGGNGKTRMKKIAYFLAAVLLFALLWTGTFHSRQERLERVEYPVLLLGDSLMGQCRDETSVAEVLSTLLGKQVFNGAFGGTCMAMQEQEMSSNYTAALLSMVSLSRAFAADDFGVQQTVRGRRAVTEYFVSTVDELERIDFEKVETLVIAFGINDYHAGIPTDNADNPMDESTYGGALRSVLEIMQSRYPNLRIVLATPTYSWYLSQELTCEEYDTGSAYLEGYVEKELSVGSEYGVEVIDLYHDLYEHDVWEDWERYTEDGLHPNENGRRLIAETLAEGLQQ
jgi:lysophospholipase L1-like esterase